MLSIIIPVWCIMVLAVTFLWLCVFVLLRFICVLAHIIPAVVVYCIAPYNVTPLLGFGYYRVSVCVCPLFTVIH